MRRRWRTIGAAVGIAAGVVLLGSMLISYGQFTRAEKRSFHEPDAVKAVAFSPDGKKIASGGSSRAIRLWEIATGRLLDVIGEDSISSIWSVSFPAYGKQVIASAGKDIFIWDLKTGQRVRLFGDTEWIQSIYVSGGGDRLISCSSDSVRVWDLLKREEIARFSQFNVGFRGVALSPDGRYAAGGNDDGMVVLWDIHTGITLHNLKADNVWVNSVAFSPDGRQLLSGGHEGTVNLWEVASGKQLKQFRHTWCVSSVAFCPDGRRAVSGGWDNVVRVWDLMTGVQMAVFKGHREFINSVAVSPDGRYAASASNDHTVRLWELPLTPASKPSAASEATEEALPLQKLSPTAAGMETAEQHEERDSGL